MTYNILAIDLGKLTGWRSPSSSGIFDCREKSSESKGIRFVRFRAYLDEICELDKINIIVYEKPGGRNFTGVRSHSNFEGVLLKFCSDKNIEFKDYAATEIKKHAKMTMIETTDLNIKGHVNKEKMVEWATHHFEEHIIDDNHADALWLYELAQKQFRNT